MDKKKSNFDSFLSKVESQGFQTRIINKGKIEACCGRGFLDGILLLLPAVKEIGINKISLTFEEREKRSCWPSDYFPDGIVLNLFHFPERNKLIRVAQQVKELVNPTSKN